MMKPIVDIKLPIDRPPLKVSRDILSDTIGRPFSDHLNNSLRPGELHAAVQE
jgi:hypothetical protein